jgi:hypothetical protein
MKKHMINKQVLSLSIETFNFNLYSSICAMNTIIMMDKKGMCNYCLFKEDLVCPGVIKKRDVRGLV